MKKIKYIWSLGIILLLNVSVFGQGPSMSPYDLKESYIEKRAAFKRINTKGVSTDEQAQLDRIVDILEKNAPNSFEYHFVKYLNGRYDLSLADRLMEAKRLQPDNVDLIPELFAYYLLIGDDKQASVYGKQVLRGVSKNTQNYYKAVLDDKTITTLLAGGVEDALPLLALQASGQIRSNVEIINFDFLLNDDYLNIINAKYGLGSLQFFNNEKAYLLKLLPKAGGGLALSTTINQAYFTSVADKMFITGLTYRYGSENQIIHLQNFWNRAKNELDGLTLNNRSERLLYRNYLPPLMTYYQLIPKGSAIRKEIKEVIIKLTEQTGKKEEVLAIIKAYDQIE